MVANNKKWTHEIVKSIVEQKGYVLIKFFEPCKDNNHKSKIIISNGYEEKLMYFDNFKRGKFRLKPNTLESIKIKIERKYNIILDDIKSISQGKTNSEDVFQITYKDKTILRSVESILHSMRYNHNLFTDKRLDKWSKQDILTFIDTCEYNFENIVLEYDDCNNENKNMCYVNFTYDKAEFRCRFRTLRDRINTGKESILQLHKGETYYKKILLNKFGIKNVGFDRIYKVTLGTKKTHMADIYNIETGEKVKGVLTDNIKKRGFWFKKYQGEELVKNELDKLNIKYTTQQTFDDCVYKCKLRFDFYLPDLNTLIEYDGEQHFRPIDMFGGDEKFNTQKIKDNIKDMFCNKNNIKLIRIPFYELKNIPQIIQDIVSSN